MLGKQRHSRLAFVGILNFQGAFILRRHSLMIGLALFAAAMSLRSLAAEPQGLPKTLRLFGRWDRRRPDRAVTVNSGSYILAHFTGSELTALFDVSINKPGVPTLAWRLDDGPWQEAEVADRVPLADHLATGPHTLMLMARGLDEHQNRWTQPLVASITFLGLKLAPEGKLLRPLPQWDRPKLKIEFLGDSITEGVLVQSPREGKTTWAWQTDARQSYAAQTAMRLNAAWRQVGFGATGLAHGGSGGAPGALESFNFFYKDCPRDDWQPDLVVVNQGTNDSGMAPDQYRPLYAKYLDLIRAAYPKAKIAAVRPFVGAQAQAIHAEVEARRAAGDTRVYYIDTEGWYSGPLHPAAEGSIPLAEKLAAALQAQVLKR